MVTGVNTRSPTGERNVYPPLKPPQECRVQLPGTVGSTEQKHPLLHLVSSFHLMEELSLDPSSVLLLLRTPPSTDAVHLINEHHTLSSPAASMVEQVSNYSEGGEERWDPRHLILSTHFSLSPTQLDIRSELETQ